jgi:hypothetical protein
MRTTFISLGALGTLAAFLTACGGGGSNATPASPVSAPAPVASINPNQTVNNFTGPTSKVTVSIKVPPRIQASAALRAKVLKKYGIKNADVHVRTMANTSPSAAIRAAGLQQNRWAAQEQKRTGRDPTFISGATQFLEFVLTDSLNNVLVDTTAGCNSSTCSPTFTVPVGNGYNVTLYLYDSCNFLISAGTTTGVNVALGVTTPVNITLNGVVRFFDIANAASQPFVADPSASQIFNVSVTAFDADSQPITTPGVLLDYTFTQIASVTLAVDTDATPAAPQTLTPQSDLSFLPTSYTLLGAGTESSVNWTATPVTTGGPIVPSFNTVGGTGGTNNGSSGITVNPATLSWSNINNYGKPGGPNFTGNGQSGPTTLWSIEFPLANNSGTYAFALAENATAFAGNITLTDNGGCSGITSSYLPALGLPVTPYQTLAALPYVRITMGSSAVSFAACVITATDDAPTPRSASLTIYTDQTSLTIQNKARTNR